LFMRSVTSSLKGWKTATTALTVLIAVQALGPGAGRPQEPAQPRIDEEITKQEKIYRSRGTDMPHGYITDRGLSDYLELLPSGFCDALGTLGSSDRWLDIRCGRGTGHTGLLRIRRRLGAGQNVRWGRRQGARGRNVHRGPPDGTMATAGC